MSEVNAAFEKWHDEFYGQQDKYSGVRSLERFPEESGLGDSYLDSTVCAQFTAFKAAQSELAALREELAVAKHDIASFLETTAKVCNLLGIDTEDAKNSDGKPSDVLFSHAEALRQRLTAAEQRNAVMTKALERITRPHDCGCVPCTGSCTSKYALEITLEEIREIADAALQPTESGASE